MNTPSSILSLVIPYHNSAVYLPSTLSSLSSQGIITRQIKLILIDDHSTDQSHDIVNSWLQSEKANWRETVHIKANESGASNARNLGILYADTTWIMFFDSDDLMMPQHLQTIVGYIKQKNTSELLYWDISIEWQGKLCRKTPRFINLNIDVVLHSVWSTQRFVVKTDFLKNVGGWDPTLVVWNDWELAIRMKAHNPSYEYIPCGSRVIVRTHPDSLTGNCYATKKGMWEKALEKTKETSLKHNAYEIVRLIELKSALLAAEYHREGDYISAIELLKTVKINSLCQSYLLDFTYRWHILFGHGISYPLYLLDACNIVSL